MFLVVVVDDVDPRTDEILGILKLESEVFADDEEAAGAPATGTPR